jgi:aspartate racemase
LEAWRLKILGIIGGIAPESTVEYYRLIISSYQTRRPDGNYPAIVVNSINLRRMLDLVAAGQTLDLAEYLSGEIRKLAAAGADLALLASHTPHLVFDALENASPIPLISIVRSSCMAARTLGLKKLGLVVTRFTMQGKFYPEVFAKEGIAVVPPTEKDQNYTHDKYMSELVNARFLPDTRRGWLAVVERMKQKRGIDGVILGGD